MKGLMDRRAVLRGGAVAGAATLAAPALAQGVERWRMVTSWPKNLPGPGVSAERLARRIGELSGGGLTVDVHAAGELVPAFEVFDAVSQGVAQMAHTASFFWAGKAPAAVFFTTVPFGLTPPEHVAWIEQGGGQALWDELYAPFGLKPFMAGNSGFQMGGWFKRPVNSLADLRGRTIRSAGLGAEVFRRLGMGATAIPPAEIYQALQSGVVDAVEFLGPFSDQALGFDEVASHYLWPSFNKPNGTAEALVSRGALEALPGELQAVVAAACAEEASRGLAEADWMNGRAIAQLEEEGRVALQRFPQDVIDAARDAGEAVRAELAAGSPEAGAIARSYEAAVETLGGWSRVSMAPFLQGRGIEA
ncbi:TRAP transporter substrate-binding protein [Lutibaculum baratangense]|uniref:TRAP transporter solute receptor n=1 Tax=Lutibaculum baratangense AMV1 TaxID=631454 RepID=V4RFS4_9HYPH|nr:TRAP transporter substrate-binding protein [Lutibaculum baratangense]ESR24229.1 TRAP transporter solute receptor, unknown substrate 6 [Lutibaculum baratangense AMV1]